MFRPLQVAVSYLFSEKKRTRDEPRIAPIPPDTIIQVKSDIFHGTATGLQLYAPKPFTVRSVAVTPLPALQVPRPIPEDVLSLPLSACKATD